MISSGVNSCSSYLCAYFLFGMRFPHVSLSFALALFPLCKHPSLVVLYTLQQRLAWAPLNLFSWLGSSPLSQALKRGGWFPSAFYIKYYLPPSPHRKPNSSLCSQCLQFVSYSAQDFSSMYNFGFLCLFWSTKMFTLFLSLVLSFCFPFILYPSLPWFWNRRDTSKDKQTMLPQLEHTDDFLIDFYY